MEIVLHFFDWVSFTFLFVSLLSEHSHIMFLWNSLCSYTAEKCNLFSGTWIRSPSGPAYSNTSCPFIEGQQNCMKNGRLDTEYLYWRWKPHDCDMPPFDAEKFLEAMRDKSWAFIGDSILRNHGQSMVCLLSKVNKSCWSW